ncbi:MAG: protein kinase domain-containing protein [Anaerolineae bacterium]
MQMEINGYKLIKQIGTGGFGEVYLAEQETVKREVAIKFILPLYANRDEFIRNFEFEAQLVARLEHPHIVPLYHYWRDNKGAFLVMRYIKGGNLADKLVTDGPLDIQATARLLEQIAGALHTAHRNQVIHQDIKPANILLDEDGNAYLTDFGIARDEAHNVNLAEDDSNTMHGSPKYISPEHLRRRTITSRSDIYSLGLLIYEVLTGHAPFEHDDMLQLLQMQVRTDLPALQDKKPDLPDALNYPLRQATLKDPQARYASVLQFASDFSAVVNSHISGSVTGTIPFSANWQVEDTGPIELRNPYKGLKAFKEGDARDFYGRETLIKSLIKSMGADGMMGRFMAVVGPSGSGKSSVVRAGLIPAIRNEQIEGLPTQYISTMIPGTRPMRALEGAILRVASRASVSLMETIAQNSYDLNEILQDALPENGEMLLLIDQFEELFTLISSEEVRRNFLNVIHKALTAENSRLRVIATLRADFFDRPLSYPDWGELFRERTEVIPAMTQTELRAAIEEPAHQSGLSLEEGLSGMIIADVSAQVGVLPLLQYTLSELYERRNGIELTIEAYQEMGGISGALAKRANEIYNTLQPEQRSLARLLFTRLVRVGEREDHTRQRVLMGEIYSLDRNFELMQNTIDTFGKYRLLTFDHEIRTHLPTVEVAHEALIRSWDLLRGWITDNADALRLQMRLSDEAKLWHEQGQDNSYLASGTRLQQFATLEDHEIIVLTKREQEYLLASLELDAYRKKRERQRQRLIQSLYIGVGVLGVIGIVLAIFANMQRLSALDARDAETIARQQADANAQESRARELAASSLLFADTRPDTAILLALESVAIQNTFEGRNALLSSLLTQDRLAGYFNGHQDFVRAVAISPDGETLASASRDGTLIIWDTRTRTARLTLEVTNSNRLNSVAFHPDDTRLLTADGDGDVVIWDSTNGERLQTLSFNEEEIRSASFSSDGALIAVGNSRGEVIWWSSEDYERLGMSDAHDGGVIYALSFSPDGTRMATAGDDNTIHIWDTEDFSLLQVIPAHTDWALALAFSPDGQYLASGGGDLTVRLWDMTTGENLWAFRAHRREIVTLAFSSDGQTVISGGLDSNIILWDAETGNFIDTIPSLGRANVRAISTEGNRLFIAGDTPQVTEIYINREPRFGEQIATHMQEILTTAVHPDGTIAYAGGTISDFAVYVLTPDSDEPQQLAHHEGIVTDLAWSSDRLISVSVDRQVAVWRDGELLEVLTPDDSVISVASHGDMIALGTNNGIIELWQVDDEETWSQVRQLEGHSNRISSLDFNADGSHLVSGSRDNSVIIWDIAQGEMIGEPLVAHTNAVEAVQFNADGTMIASGGRDNNIILWSVSEQEPLGPPLVRHENWINDLAFSPTGNQLISVSGDNSVILWDALEQRAIGLPLFGHGAWVNSVSFADDGTYMVTGARNGSLIRWQTTLDSWINIACEVANRPLNAGERRDYFGESYQPADHCLTN